MHIANRLSNIEKDRIDWATAEIMALGSLNLQGFNTRLVGEDSERGTFSQRHAVFHDQTLHGRTFNPILSNIDRSSAKTGRFEVSNTNLCEVATMAYEYGYSLESPWNLCLWEAQFGDFYNPAQMIVDQYLMCSEAKWLRQSGLVLLLPHGFDGAGPEHSTCHIERFLQNINSNIYDPANLAAHRELNGRTINFQVAQPTMPANYFHLLRRQMLRDYRKPLVIAAPKIGLKHPMAQNPLSDFSEGEHFQPILTKTHQSKGASDHLKFVFCSGRIAFDLDQLIQESADDLATNICVIRVEELAPFPSHLIVDEIQNQQGSSTEFFWVQEEPVNEGAFQFAKLHIDRIIAEVQGSKESELQFIGRPSGHSFCVGAAVDHKRQTEAI